VLGTDGPSLISSDGVVVLGEKPARHSKREADGLIWAQNTLSLLSSGVVVGVARNERWGWLGKNG
jgi:hypothetical protein